MIGVTLYSVPNSNTTSCAPFFERVSTASRRYGLLLLRTTVQGSKQEWCYQLGQSAGNRQSVMPRDLR